MREFDPSQLIENCGNKVELAKKVLAAFVRLSPNLVDKIALALEEGDHEQARVNSHTLRGSSMTIGAERLADICHRIESKAYEAAHPLGCELRQEYDSAAVHIGSFLADS
jgi:HPt (histidine-containing phosphotransfer) domain-containing protein